MGIILVGRLAMRCALLSSARPLRLISSSRSPDFSASSLSFAPPILHVGHAMGVYFNFHFESMFCLDPPFPQIHSDSTVRDDHATCSALTRPELRHPARRPSEPSSRGGYSGYGGRRPEDSEGGMMRLETLVELKFLNSSFSSSNFSIRAFRAYPLVEIEQTVPCRAIRGNSLSVNSTLPPS